jgi:hypothetical protein
LAYWLRKILILFSFFFQLLMSRKKGKFKAFTTKLVSRTIRDKLEDTRVESNGTIISYFRQIDGIAPTFAKKPAIRQLEDGKCLLFECRVQADPVPNISWSHNGAQVSDSSRHKVSWPQIYISFTGGLIVLCFEIYFRFQHRKMGTHTLQRWKLKMSQSKMLVNTR